MNNAIRNKAHVQVYKNEQQLYLIWVLMSIWLVRAWIKYFWEHRLCAFTMHVFLPLFHCTLDITVWKLSFFRLREKKIVINLLDILFQVRERETFTERNTISTERAFCSGFSRINTWFLPRGRSMLHMLMSFSDSNLELPFSFRE